MYNVDYLAKIVRDEAGVSQQALASELGTTVVTISRWENGKVIPNKMAQARLFEYVLGKNLNSDLADRILRNLENDCKKSIGGQQVLYHGSGCGIEGQIQPISREHCDFGSGFYMGTDPMQPLTLICNENNPHFYTLSLNAEGLNVRSFEAGIDWAFLVAYHRGYLDEYKQSPIYRKYECMTEGIDLIKAPIADDRLYMVLTKFFRNEITDEALTASMTALNLGIQYVAVSKKACGDVEILNDRVLSDFELMVLKEKSRRTRKEAIDLTNKIMKDYRRKGKFFDELLEEADGE